jgi:hypothetical protein
MTQKYIKGKAPDILMFSVQLSGYNSSLGHQRVSTDEHVETYVPVLEGF